MGYLDQIKQFYVEHIEGAVLEKAYLKAPCPFCSQTGRSKPGVLVVYLNPESYFAGYFRCMSRCRPRGFPLHFARISGIDAKLVPGYDPDREPFVRDMIFPVKNLKADITKFSTLLSENEVAYFQDFGVSEAALREMHIGYNGRYMVYPYYLEDNNSYAARCVLPAKANDFFWHGNEKFFAKEFQIFDLPEIDRCEDGALFVTTGEDNLLTLKELGYPGIAVPSAADLEIIEPERLAHIKHVFIITENTPEAYLSARELASRLGFKVKILQWPSQLERGYTLCDLARDKGKDFRAAISGMIHSAKSFSPFTPPESEHRKFFQVLQKDMGKDVVGLTTGFEKLDAALSGIRGINIMGGPPKAGKSCFYMQVSTEMARRRIPVIYYDFENGRQKIDSRTLSRISRLSDREIRIRHEEPEVVRQMQKANAEFREMLKYFRVVTDRKLNPEIMRRQIDFLQNETRTDANVVVVDSLHKLPFKNLSDRRTGIDSWLRHMEAIRDEQNVSFFVISELSRGDGNRYAKKPDLGSFKGSGDIEYSADNAMILIPDWDPVDPISSTERVSMLWLVASRENNPGKIGEYSLEYPYWGFREM